MGSTYCQDLTTDLSAKAALQEQMEQTIPDAKSEWPQAIKAFLAILATLSYEKGIIKLPGGRISLSLPDLAKFNPGHPYAEFDPCRDTKDDFTPSWTDNGDVLAWAKRKFSWA